jgi:hypothetical protein
MIGNQEAPRMRHPTNSIRELIEGNNWYLRPIWLELKKLKNQGLKWKEVKFLEPN